MRPSAPWLRCVHDSGPGGIETKRWLNMVSETGRIFERLGITSGDFHSQSAERQSQHFKQY